MEKIELEMLKKRAYRERFKANLRIKALKEIENPNMPRKPKKPKGPNQALTTTQITMLMGCSRQKVAKLMKKGVLKDKHPLSVAKLINRVAFISKRRSERFEKKYRQWKEKQEKYLAAKENFKNC